MMKKSQFRPVEFDRDSGESSGKIVEPPNAAPNVAPKRLGAGGGKNGNPNPAASECIQNGGIAVVGAGAGGGGRNFQSSTLIFGELEDSEGGGGGGWKVIRGGQRSPSICRKISRSLCKC